MSQFRSGVSSVCEPSQERRADERVHSQCLSGAPDSQGENFVLVFPPTTLCPV